MKETCCEYIIFFLSVGNRSHGLQVLGKVQSRRVLTPANLPSLKSENSGNDPRVNLVPSGSQGWGKKEISSQQTSKQADSTVTVSNVSLYFCVVKGRHMVF